MKRNFSLISALFLSLGLLACGGGAPQPTQQELQEFWAASSLKTQLTGLGNPSGGNSNIVTSPENPLKQILVGGTVSGEGSGLITVSVHETEACAKGYCPVESKAPLASTQIMDPGYFSVLVPSQGQKLTLIAKRGDLSGMRYLGELSERLEGIEISLE